MTVFSVSSRQLIPAILMVCVLGFGGVTLSGCAPIALGAGAVTGVAAAKEGGITQSTRDAQIELAISDMWFKYDLNTFSKLSLTVEQGRVLITGVVQDPKDRVEAVRLAWQAPHVKQVINEIRVADSEGIKGYVRDSWITAQLRTAILLDKNIQSINYSIDTVQGTVYLMGVAQNKDELNTVIEHARTTKYVQQVVSYVKMLGEPIENLPGVDGGTSEIDMTP